MSLEDFFGEVPVEKPKPQETTSNMIMECSQHLAYLVYKEIKHEEESFPLEDFYKLFESVGYLEKDISILWINKWRDEGLIKIENDYVSYHGITKNPL